MAAGEEWFLGWGARRIALPEGEHVLGRSRDSDVVVRDATVSRAHALLAVAGGRVRVQDLGSSNGTLVNGERVREETELAAGDQLRLGRVRMTLGRAAAGGASVAATSCPGCGSAVDPGAAECPRCGESLTDGRPLSRSEAVAMSEVMAVGEALARPPRSLEETLPPFPLAWAEPAGEGEADDGTGAEDDDDEGALSLAAPARRDPPREALEDASSPVAVARAAEEDSPPPRPPGAGAGAEDEAAAADEPAPAEAEREAGEPPPLFLPAAGFWTRAAAGAIDLAGPLALGIVVGVAVSGWTPRAGLAAGLAAGLLAWLAVTVPGWRRGGASPGKRLLGLRVCDLDGRPGVGGRRALLRFAGYLLSVLTFGVGFLLAGLTAGRRALHDRLAGTYVGRLQGAARGVAGRST